MQARTCLRCGEAMEPGSVYSYGLFPGRVRAWAPEHSRQFQMSLKFSKDESLPVITYRCTKCGALESVAPPSPRPE